MLVLARKTEEKIHLKAGDEDIVIQVVNVRGSSQCRLGVTAPRSVRVRRWEHLTEEEQAEAEAAASRESSKS